MILLDTCVLVDYDQYRFDTQDVYGASILSRAELEFGAHSAVDPSEFNRRMHRLEYFDRMFNWLDFDLECSRAYGFVAANASVRGARMRSKDALIAAQARRHGAAVMTTNLADFAPFAHLIEVVQPTSS